jgi:hypothetical protein
VSIVIFARGDLAMQARKIGEARLVERQAYSINSNDSSMRYYLAYTLK